MLQNCLFLLARGQFAESKMVWQNGLWRGYVRPEANGNDMIMLKLLAMYNKFHEYVKL